MKLIIEGDDSVLRKAEKLLKAFKVSVSEYFTNDENYSLSLENDHLKKSLESANAEIELLKASKQEPESDEEISEAEEPSEGAAPAPVQKPKGKSKK